MIGLALTRDTDSNKAVAVGAVSFYLNHFVTGRISKFTYGTSFHTAYIPSDPDHVSREHKTFVDPAGEKRVPGRFDSMLLRVRHLSFFYTDSPRQIRYITGYYGSGGPGTPTPPSSHNPRRSTATGLRENFQVHWYK